MDGRLAAEAAIIPIFLTDLTLELLRIQNKGRRQKSSAAARGRPSYDFKSKTCITGTGNRTPTPPETRQSPMAAHEQAFPLTQMLPPDCAQAPFEF